MRLFPLVLLLTASAPTLAAGHDDPRGLIPAARPPISAGQRACGAIPAKALTLPDLVDIALCNNPATAVSWASVRAAAANVGVAQSANLPTISATFGPVLTRTDAFAGSAFGSGGATEVDTTARLALSYLLFDFGTRAAQIDASRASQRAALAQFADTAQGVALTTVTAFNTLQADLATATAAEATVAFAQKSYDFADGRKRAGTITGADRLQALTSLSQAQLTLIQARGNIATSRAQLAVAIGLPPETLLDLAAVAPLSAAPLLKSGARALIAQAERLRPDIAASRANIDVADANLRAARSAALPTVNVSASDGISAVDRNVTGNSGQIGVTLSVPIFSGFNRRYTIAAARAESERQTALAEQTRQQAGLTVYTGYVALDTAVKSLVSARDLIASAQANADLAQGRYKAGVGLFTDLLNAQSALASARQQLVTAEFNVRTSDANLARAVGGIGDAVDELRGAR